MPGNMYFTTTRLHQELAGGTFVDVIVDESHDPQDTSPSMGNVDLAKLDALVNIGGFLATNDADLYRRACDMVVVDEGLHTCGAMAGRDMEAMAIGIRESIDDHHIRARVGQVEYPGRKLEAAGVPIVRPIGGHALFLDARRILPHIPQEQSRRRRWRRRSASTRACARWSAASSRPGATPRPARTTSPGSSSCA